MTGPRAALFNDTGTTAHVGCLAVSDAHNRMLARNGVEVAYRFFVGQLAGMWRGDAAATMEHISRSFLHNVIAGVDAVVVNGEGTIHHGAGQELLAILAYAQALGKRTLLVNCVLQELPPGWFDTLRRLDDLTCREPRTHAYLAAHDVPARVVLDSIVEAGFAGRAAAGDFRDRIVVTDHHALRDGDVGSALKGLMTRGDCIYFPLEHPSHHREWQLAVASLREARLVVTGRHHGVYLAALAGVPFIALGSNTWKVEGTLELFRQATGHGFSFHQAGPVTAESIEQALEDPRRYRDLHDYLRASRPLDTLAALAPPAAAAAASDATVDAPATGGEPLARGVVLAVNCVPEQIAPDIKQFWERLARQLAEQGFLLVIASTAPLQSSALNVIEVPYQLTDFIRRYPDNLDRGHGVDGPMVRTLQDWYRCGPDDAAQALDLAHGFYRALLSALKPAAVLGWQSMHPGTRILMQEAAQAGVPSWVGERGWVQDTLMFDLSDNNYLSEIQRSLTIARLREASVFDPARFAAISERAATVRAGRYQSVPAMDGQALRAKLGIPRDATVFGFFTHGEPSLHMSGPSALGELHATSRGRLQAQLDAACTYCIEHGAWLLLQDHPFNAGEGYLLRLPEHAQVMRVQEHPHSLLEAADHYLFTITTLQYDAVFRGKHFGLLSKSSLHSPGGAYFHDDYADTAAFMAAVEAGTDWPQRLQTLQRTVAFLFDHYLLDIASADAVETSAARLANHLAQFERPVDAGLPDRIDALLARWKAA